MSERGVFAVDRGIWDHPVFANEALTEREAWIWLIGDAAFKERTKRVGSVTVKLAPGQVANSTRFMADKWGWSEPRVRRFLKRLKTDAMIDAATDAGVTVITICNYRKYQRVSLPSDKASDAQGDAATTQPRRKVEDKEDKEMAEAKASARKRTTRLASDALPSERNIADALAIGLESPEIDQQWRRMRDWSASSPKGACLNWDARWRNWCETYIGGRNGHAVSQARTFGASGPAATGADAILAGMGRIAARVTARQLAERQGSFDLAAKSGSERGRP